MTVATWINDRQAVNAIKSSLQTNLEDPRRQYTNEIRSWVHTDLPLTTATYPRIQVRRRGPTTTQIISMGQEFVEWRSLILDIQFWTKDPFKWKDTTNTYYKNEELVKEYLDKIWRTLKSQQSSLHTTYGITGLKPIDEEDPSQEAATQNYTGRLSVRVWYFRKI